MMLPPERVARDQRLTQEIVYVPNAKRDNGLRKSYLPISFFVA